MSNAFLPIERPTLSHLFITKCSFGFESDRKPAKSPMFSRAFMRSPASVKHLFAKRPECAFGVVSLVSFRWPGLTNLSSGQSRPSKGHLSPQTCRQSRRRAGEWLYVFIAKQRRRYPPSDDRSRRD